MDTTIPANGPSVGFTAGGTQPGFSADELGVTITNATATNVTLLVHGMSSPTGALTFVGGPYKVGDSGQMSIVLTNPNGSTNIPLTSFTHTLPNGFVVSATPNASVVCAGTGSSNGTLTTSNVNASPANDTITVTGGAIGNGGTCTILVNVTPTTALIPG